MVKSRYQFICTRNKKVKAMEILVDRNYGIPSFKVDLKTIDPLLVRWHIKNLRNAISSFTKKELSFLERLVLHINVFPSTLTSETLFNDSVFVSALLDLPFKAFCFEVIEGEILKRDVLVNTLTSIKTLSDRFLIAVDDFGTGGMAQDILLHLRYFDFVKFDFSAFKGNLSAFYYISEKVKDEGRGTILEKTFSPDRFLNIDLFQSFDVHYPKPIDELQAEIKSIIVSGGIKIDC